MCLEMKKIVIWDRKKKHFIVIQDKTSSGALFWVSILLQKEFKKREMHGNSYKSSVVSESENGIESSQNIINLTALWTKHPFTYESGIENW